MVVKRIKYYLVFNDEGYSIGRHCEECVWKSEQNQRIAGKTTTKQLMDNKKQNLGCVYCDNTSPATSPKARRLIKELDELHHGKDPVYERLKKRYKAKRDNYNEVSQHLAKRAKREGEILDYFYPENAKHRQVMSKIVSDINSKKY